MATLEEALALASLNKRACPQPTQWHQLYNMLPDRRGEGVGAEPALPLILAAWWDTPALLKALRLREHLEWAHDHGCLDQVYSFMELLPEDKWYHFGE